MHRIFPLQLPVTQQRSVTSEEIVKYFIRVDVISYKYKGHSSELEMGRMKKYGRK